jgi:hypothetical protein
VRNEYGAHLSEIFCRARGRVERLLQLLYVTSLEVLNAPLSEGRKPIDVLSAIHLSHATEPLERI